MKKIERKNYSIHINEEMGSISGLYDSHNPKANWISEEQDTFFGIPFINGTQWNENNLPMVFAEKRGNELFFQTESKVTNILYLLGEESIRVKMKTAAGCGPRTGIQLSLNFLDLETKGSWEEQCMPKVIYVDEDYRYAYFIFCTVDNRYLAIAVTDSLAAWRIKYSYAGHRMCGFQLLTQADDVVVTEGRKALPCVEELDFTIFFGLGIAECLQKIAGELDISIAVPAISGGVKNAVVPFKILGNARITNLLEPNGTCRIPANQEVVCRESGIYRLITVSGSGKEHTTRLFCQETWKSMFWKINNFYKNYFQDTSGAFYRAIWKEELSPDKGNTMEGTAFGDINELFSCRSGEFGGFAAWAMLKGILLFGKEEGLLKAVQKYICNWALNQGHEEVPYNGSICKFPAEFLNRQYGAYHLFREVNYPQHEIFLLEQLIDYYAITKEPVILEEAYQLGIHFIEEHMEENGCVICQNEPEGETVDYCTVHVPVYGLIKLSGILKENGSNAAGFIMEKAEKLGDYVCKRGLDFPTEGESCTEDGSMACSALTLLYSYLYIKPKKEYLCMAETILQAHNVLILEGVDCRMKNSTIRFWETQYETRDWGPSINAGHAWSLWTAKANVLLAIIKHDFNCLLKAYEGFVTNMCKVEENGAMTSCYTPDMIPGLPHAPCVWGMSAAITAITELRPTTAELAMDYPGKTYSASGNYLLIEAAETWSHISGVDLDNKVCINGFMENDIFISAAVKFDYLLICGVPKGNFSIKCKAGKELTVAYSADIQDAAIRGGSVIKRKLGEINILPDMDMIQLSVCHMQNDTK